MLVALGKSLLQSGVLLAQFLQTLTHGIDLPGIVHRAGHFFAAVPPTGLDLVGEPDGCSQQAFAAAASRFPVELVADERAADIQVQVPTGAETECVQYTDVSRGIDPFGILRRFHQTYAGVGNAVVESVLLVSADDVGEVEHGVEMEVVVIELRLVEALAPSVYLLTGRMCRSPAGGSLDGESVVSEPYADIGREPLADGYVEGRGEPLSERYLLVVVAEEDLCAAAYADYPVAPESVCLDLVFVRAVFHGFRDLGILLRLSVYRTCSHKKEDCQ